MRQSARRALARSVNDLADARAEEDGDLEEAADEVIDRLSILLERDDLQTETVERNEVGARTKVKMSRGEGVRDQDEWTIEGKGADAEEAAQEFDVMLDRYEREWADRVRALQPDGEPVDADGERIEADGGLENA